MTDVAVASQPNRAAPPGWRQRPLASMWFVTYPIIVGSLSGVLLTVADTAMLSRVSTEAIAAVAVAAPVYIVASMVVTGWATGVQVLAARRHGAGETAAIGAVLDVGLALSVIAALVLMVPLMLAAPALIALMTDDPAVARLGAVYLAIMASSLPFAAAMSVFRSVYAGLGATKVTMRAAVTVNLLNVPLGLMLIFGLGLGVAGAAIASVIATAAGAAYLAWYGGRHLSASHAFYRRANLAAWRATVQPIWRIGWPETLMLVTGYFQTVLIVRFVSHLGVEDLGASSVVTSVITVLWTIIYSTSSGVSILVGQRLGADDLQGSFRYQHAGALLMALLVGVLLVPVVLAPAALFGLLSPDPNVVAAATTAGYVVAAQMPLVIATMVLAGTLRAAGDTKTLMYAGMVANYVFYLPLAWLFGLGLGLGLPGIYLGWATYWIARFGVTYYRYRQGRWQTAKV
jgi:multidrug resistance protein, MATE family